MFKNIGKIRNAWLKYVEAYLLVRKIILLFKKNIKAIKNQSEP